MTRIYLSPPEVGAEERRMLLEAFDSNWIAPTGPDLDAFEREMADEAGVAHAVALSSGTAALHLALLLAGVEGGDEVLVPSFTFIASAAAVTYLGATPVFVDCSPDSWNLDPFLVEEALIKRAAAGRLPAALVTVDLYGETAEYHALESLCRRFEVPLIEDSAEALGSTHGGRPAGSFGAAGVFSFNGNKIITTSGGGMLVTGSQSWAERARHLATAAREPFVHYEHAEVGYNYRLSNLLAALGRAQLRGLDNRMARARPSGREVPGRAGPPSRDLTHAAHGGRYVQLLAHLCPHRSRRLRNGSRARAPGSGGGQYRVSTDVEASPSAARIRRGGAPRIRTLRPDFRAGTLPPHRVGAVRR